MEQKVSLSGAPETMLGTLYLRAKAGTLANPVLVDRHAAAAVERLDYDFGRLRLDNRDPNTVAIRAVSIDRRVRDLVAARPDRTVLHLGCGLDSRGLRMDLPPSVEWYDVDFPEVIDLRRKLYEQTERHHTIASSVTDPALFDSITGDRRVLVVAEGLTMYLDPQEGLALLRRITERFPAGDLICDVQGELAVRFANVLNSPVRAANAKLRWAIGSGAELVNAVPGLALDEELTFFEVPGLERLPASYRALVRAMGHIPALRRMALILRMHFDG